MESSSRGRHRRAPVRRSLPLVAVAVGGVVLVAAAAVTTAAVTGARRTPVPAATPTTAAAPSTTPEQPAVLAATRNVRVDQGVVTIVESTTVTEGDNVVVAPARGSHDPALQLTRVQVLAEDGTLTPLTEPVSLGAGRTLTVHGTYRMPACPDVLPVSWPSPIEVAGSDWSRSFTRTSEPLRTAPTLCPGKPSRARDLPDLAARIADVDPGGRLPTVRILLRWRGLARLAVDDVGTLSDLAADTPTARSPGEGCPERGCVGDLAPDGTLALDVQPVEACPNQAQRPDRLSLQVRVAGGPPRLVAVEVPGLGRWLDSHVCR